MDTSNPYPGRRAHWVRLNHTERMPHRWIVADSEAYRGQAGDVETQTLRCWDATRWRDDLQTGDHAESAQGEDAASFWQWVDDYTRAGARTVLWFHNASYDLRTLDVFRQLPALGWELEWCNLDRDVSVATWRSGHGTLVIADTWTWLAKPLSDISGMVGIGKPALPDHDDSLDSWHARCAADVAITRAAVLELLAFVKSEHLGNWQPSGAGMGYATWRHRFLKHKVLVHDDAPAIAAERAAMHAGRAEAWWHGKALRGPFTEYDMHMAYCRIAAECDVPVKLFAYDPAPSPAVHKWAMRYWTVLARVRVTTEQPVVPCQTGERTIWPVGTFETTLWQPELQLITATGGSYEVLEQWRYNTAPALRAWAKWSMALCGPQTAGITPVQRTWVKHQSRALIGRLALRNACWTEWGANPFGWCGLTDLVDGETGQTARMMHVGSKTFVETERREADSSLPQITGYVMSVSRVRLWDACAAAGAGTVQHIDTDSLIVNRDGAAALQLAVAAGLPGGWRPKEKWTSLDVTGPRHYRSSGRRVIPGVPVSALETAPGEFHGQVWESLATSLERQSGDVVRVLDRVWRPKRFDGRRPWQGEGPAQPIRLPADSTERTQHDGAGGTGDDRDSRAAADGPASERRSGGTGPRYGADQRAAAAPRPDRGCRRPDVPASGAGQISHPAGAAAFPAAGAADPAGDRQAGAVGDAGMGAARDVPRRAERPGEAAGGSGKQSGQRDGPGQGAAQRGDTQRQEPVRRGRGDRRGRAPAGSHRRVAGEALSGDGRDGRPGRGVLDDDRPGRAGRGAA